MDRGKVMYKVYKVAPQKPFEEYEKRTGLKPIND